MVPLSSRSLIAVIARLTISMFSCDIAHAVSRGSSCAFHAKRRFQRGAPGPRYRSHIGSELGIALAPHYCDDSRRVGKPEGLREKEHAESRHAVRFVTGADRRLGRPR